MVIREFWWEGLPMNLRQRKGQLAGWEALIILVLLAGLGVMTYLYAQKPSQANVYQTGSKPIVQQPTYSPHFGCVDVKAQEFMDSQRQLTTNAVGGKITS